METVVVRDYRSPPVPGLVPTPDKEVAMRIYVLIVMLIILICWCNPVF